MKQLKKEAKEETEGFPSMLLGMLGARLLGYTLAGKGINRAGYGNKKRKVIIRAGYGSKLDYSRYNLPNKIKDGAYVKNLDEYSDIGTHLITLYALNNNNVTYFDSFGVEHLPKEI